MKIKIAAALAFAALGLASVSNAGPADPIGPSPAPVPGESNGSASTAYPDLWYWGSLHSHNRVIAFGSLLIEKSGSNIDTWKEARPYGFCMEGGGVVISNPKTGDDGTAGGGDDPGSGSTSPSDPVPDPIPIKCGWSLMITTAYQFVECPDGRAYITRSGDGVALENIHEGKVFGWAEGVACGDGPFFGKDTKAAQDVNRPLDVANLTITMKN